MTRHASARAPNCYFPLPVHLILALTLLATCFHVGVADARAPEDRIVFVLERTTRGPSSFNVYVSAQGGNDGSFIGSAFAAIKNRRISEVWPGISTSVGRTDQPSVFTPAGSLSTCDAGLCDLWFSAEFQAISYTDDEGGDALNRTFIAIEGQIIDHEFEGEGWRLRKVPWDFRFIDGTESEAAGVRIGDGHGGEVFQRAALPGGRYGSIAQAMPPCSSSIVNVAPRGVGTVELTGGVEAMTGTCPTEDARDLISWATRATDWQLEGAAVGDPSLAETRLFVLDLPRSYQS